MLVVDASVLATALSDDGPDGDTARARLRGEALADLADIPLERASHGPLVARCWALRDNLTVYDAAYVALAEALTTSLLTADVRLANAPGVACPVEVL